MVLKKEIFIFLLGFSQVVTSIKAEEMGTSDILNKVLENEQFPSGCGKAFMEVEKFLGFYESTLAQIAMIRGPQTKGLSDLYATWEIRNSYNDLIRGKMKESLIDSLIMAQLCKFEKIWASKLKPGVPSKNLITSDDAELHNHLLALSAKLLGDSKKIAESFVSEERQEKAKKMQLMDRVSQIKKANEAGKEQVRDLLIELKRLNSDF